MLDSSGGTSAGICGDAAGNAESITGGVIPSVYAVIDSEPYAYPSTSTVRPATGRRRQPGQIEQGRDLRPWWRAAASGDAGRSDVEGGDERCVWSSSTSRCSVTPDRWRRRSARESGPSTTSA